MLMPFLWRTNSATSRPARNRESDYVTHSRSTYLVASALFMREKLVM
jgi:hypothetical protein